MVNRVHKIRVFTSTLHQSIKFMHKGMKVTIYTEDNPIDVCQENRKFWIPHDFFKSEEDAPTHINYITP